VRLVPRAQYEESPSELAQLGQALRDLRQGKGLKLIEVATAAGMTESQISDIERGKNNPGWLVLMRLLDGGLELTLNDLASAYERAQRQNADGP
jgi:transcriptional regulator with XRE-family HTH domain